MTPDPKTTCPLCGLPQNHQTMLECIEALKQELAFVRADLERSRLHRTGGYGDWRDVYG